MASAPPPTDPARPAGETRAARLHLWQIQGVRDVATMLALATLVYLGYWLREVTVPLLIALALAYLFEPVVRRLSAVRGVTRPGAVIILMLTVGVTTTAGLVLTTPVVVSQSIRLVERVRTSDFLDIGLRAVEMLPEQYRGDAREAIEWMQRQWQAARRGDPIEYRADVEDGDDLPTSTIEEPTAEGAAASELADRKDDADVDRDALREIVREELLALGLDGSLPPATPRTTGGTMRLLGLVGPTAQGVSDLLLGLLRLSLVAFLIPFYFYFFSVYYPKIIEFGQSLIPEGRRDRMEDLIGRMDRAVSGFVRGRIVISVLMGVGFAIGWLLCGVPYAIALGFFVGAVSIVPYLGGIGLPLAVGFLLFDQIQLPAEARMAWWAILAWPTVVFVLVQLIESYVLTPIIAGKATDLDPVTIVVAILAGGSVAGVYGMLLAIPAAACGKILLKEVILPSIRAWARGETPDPLPIGGADDGAEASGGESR